MFKKKLNMIRQYKMDIICNYLTPKNVCKCIIKRCIGYLLRLMRESLFDSLILCQSNSIRSRQSRGREQ